MFGKKSHVDMDCSDDNMHVTNLNIRVTDVNMYVTDACYICPTCNSQYKLSLMINTMQYGVVKSFIQWQLGYKVLRD